MNGAEHYQTAEQLLDHEYADVEYYAAAAAHAVLALAGAVDNVAQKLSTLRTEVAEELSLLRSEVTLMRMDSSEFQKLRQIEKLP